MKILLTFVLVLYILTTSSFQVLAKNQSLILADHHYYSVSDVAQNDVLNIRSGPAGSSEIVGFFSHDEDLIEVISFSKNGKWGLVNIIEGTGWTSMRFLKRIKPHSYGSSNIPTELKCHGKDHNWSVRTNTNVIAFSEYGRSTVSYSIEKVQEFRNPNSIVLLADPSLSSAFDINKALTGCTNEAGNIYPWEMEVYFENGSQLACCSIGR